MTYPSDDDMHDGLDPAQDFRARIFGAYIKC